MAFWSTGGEVNQPFGPRLGDNNCHEREGRRVGHYSHGQMETRTFLPSPQQPFAPNILDEGFNHYEAVRHARPQNTNVRFFVLNEHDSRSSSAPPSHAGAHRWNPGALLKTGQLLPSPLDFVGTHPSRPFDEDQLSYSPYADRRKRPTSPPRDASSKGPAPGGKLIRTTSSRRHSRRNDAVSKVADVPLQPSDLAEADIVQAHLATFQRRFPDSKHERILRNLINPKSLEASFRLDDDALESIFCAMNEIFFDGKLTKRVEWQWSHETAGAREEYESRIAGHTSLRRSAKGGYETCITLSTPILTDPKYSRRLLISAFLHELIHCFLFICCGFKAKESNGHTPGFKAIARIIDNWAGPGKLYLCEMEADLKNFRAECPSHSHSHSHHHHRRREEPSVATMARLEERQVHLLEERPDHSDASTGLFRPLPAKRHHDDAAGDDDSFPASQYDYCNPPPTAVHAVWERSSVHEHWDHALELAAQSPADPRGGSTYVY